MAVTIQGIEVSWDRARDLFSLDPAVTYLNHGAFGAVPIPVQRAQQRLRTEMDANPMAFFTLGLTDRLAHTLRHLSGFLRADPDGTALVPNATAGVQLALGSVRLGPADEMLLTAHGYGAVRLAVERAGATITEVAIPLAAGDDEIVAIIARAARPGRTRLAIVDHVTSPTARLFPVARIVAALRERDVPTLVDGAHVPGMLDVDVSAIGADFWLGNFHKWAFAPRPTAVLVVAPAHRGSVEPLVVSWENGTGFPGSVEFGGTLDYTPWLAAPTGIHLLRTLDVDRVRRHNADLASHGQRVLAEALGRDPGHDPGHDSGHDSGHEPGRDHAGLSRPNGVGMRLIPLPPGAADDPPSALRLRARIALTA